MPFYFPRFSHLMDSFFAIEMTSGPIKLNDIFRGFSFRQFVEYSCDNIIKCNDIQESSFSICICLRRKSNVWRRIFESIDKMINTSISDKFNVLSDTRARRKSKYFIRKYLPNEPNARTYNCNVVILLFFSSFVSNVRSIEHFGKNGFIFGFRVFNRHHSKQCARSVENVRSSVELLSESPCLRQIMTALQFFSALCQLSLDEMRTVFILLLILKWQISHRNFDQMFCST